MSGHSPFVPPFPALTHQLRTRYSCCKGWYIGSARGSALCALVGDSLERDVKCLWRDIRYGVMKVSAFR
jgi:hypothetical protein